MSSTGPLLHLNELKEQLFSDGLGEYVVDSKIMHQCDVDKDLVERPFDGNHLLMEENNKNVFLCNNTWI